MLSHKPRLHQLASKVSMETLGVLPSLLRSAISGMPLASRGAGLLLQPLEPRFG